jgi:hypothetical protein
MPHDCGSTRRLQALTAIGWDTDTLATELGWTTSQLHRALSAGQTPPHTRHHITALYDLLSMTPGPSTTARQHAQQHGWPPPLAWDDEHLDNPDATPAPGWQPTTKRQPFTDRYQEWRTLGYTDLEILHRFNIRPDTLATMLHRAGLPVSPQLSEASHQHKTRTSRAYA